MRFVRYRKTGSRTAKYGWICGDFVGEIEGDIFSEFRRLEAVTPLPGVQLLAPVVPGKIIGVEWNYLDQIREYDRSIPAYPSIFLKSPSSLIGMNDAIQLPKVSERVEQECELAVIIGKRARNIPPEAAFSHIFGYTIANDITARDLQSADEPWTRSKGFDTFCPMGPVIETEFEPADSLLTCRVNGVMCQMASTRDMIFPVQNLIAFISGIMTLEVGDVILTGSSSGSTPLSDGDVVDSVIDGIGTLTNHVRAAND